MQDVVDFSGDHGVVCSLGVSSSGLDVPLAAWKEIAE